MPDILRVGAEFDVSQLVAGSQKAGASFDALKVKFAEVAAQAETAGQSIIAQAARMQAQGLSADEAASALVNLGVGEKEAAEGAAVSAAAAGVEATALQTVAAAATTASIAHEELNVATHSARLATDLMTGQVGRAEQSLIRMAAATEAIGPIIQAAFVPFILITAVNIFVEMAEKVYHVFENVVLLRGAIEALGVAEAKEAERAASLNFTYEEMVAHRLASLNKFAEAADAFRKAEQDKPLQLFGIDDKILNQFSSEFSSFIKEVHTSADAPTVITRIKAEAQSTQEQLDKTREKLASIVAAASDPSQAEALSGLAILERRYSAEVEDLTRKLGVLKLAIGQVQSQAGTNDLTLQNSLSQVVAAQKHASEEAVREADKAEKERLKIARESFDAQVNLKNQLAKATIPDFGQEPNVALFNAANDEMVAKAMESLHLIQRAEISSETEFEIILLNAVQARGVIMARAHAKETEESIRAARIQEQAMEQSARRMQSVFMGSFDAIIRGTETVKFGFIKLGGDILLAMVHSLEQMVFHALAKEAAILAAHLAGESAQTAATAAGAQARSSIGVLEGIKSIGRAAAVAAAHAFKWVMEEVPFPLDVVLAPVVAAGTFAAVLGFQALAGAAEKGAVVPRDMPIFAHAEEMILPRHISVPLQAALAGGGAGAGGRFGGGGGGGSGTTINIQALDGASLASFLYRNQRSFVSMAKGAVRNGRF